MTSLDTKAGSDERERHAQLPVQSSGRRLKDGLVRCWQALTTKNLGIVAAGVAFYSLLAIFPGLAALVSFYGLVANPSDVQSLIGLTGQVIPGDANQLLADQMTALINKPSGGLTLAAVFGFLFALWSAHSGLATLMTALNIAYGETERRGYIRRNLLALGLTFGAMLFIIVTLALVALLPVVIAFLPLPAPLKDLLSLGRWPILVVMVMLALAVIYRLGPSRGKPRWRWVSAGAVVATILWIVGSAAFSAYVSRFGSYDKTYGSLGAVIVLLMWLYISGYFVLIGAVINAEAEHPGEAQAA